ncbi:hypothetical protein AM493_18790 [Flavobacterium akiainvivens]|uniref:Lipoprotein n=1 Tax=Flavobacterium akiainvivens TaxID=1202724 RepID=A0A0M8MKT6_9FLAO|nr:MucBP domain-containing protein [Flavobacterium akiainvivens]KOS07877.1 hypothetical protein AM493_18790 [Flavobacterium akiainvivens]SFQ27988.1 hypothetical protein SAMN05444144_102340 [Flavobacterium akiainvivens]
MKTRLLLALGAFVGFLTTSCNINETITFSEDGSGVMKLEMDGEQLMAMAGGQMGDKKERIDSTFNFREVFKGKADSIAKLPKAEQDRIKALQNLEGHLLMDSESGELKITFDNKFKNASELVNMMNGTSEFKKGFLKGAAQGMQEEGMPDMGLDDAEPAITYSYDGKKFKKTVAEVPPKEEEEENEIMAQLYQAFEGSTYTVNYKFPKKIKSVSNKAGKISDDKKTVTVVYQLVDYMDNPKSMDLEVVFE